MHCPGVGWEDFTETLVLCTLVIFQYQVHHKNHKSTLVCIQWDALEIPTFYHAIHSHANEDTAIIVVVLFRLAHDFN
jgi:hypothetical protein